MTTFKAMAQTLSRGADEEGVRSNDEIDSTLLTRVLEVKVDAKVIIVAGVKNSPQQMSDDKYAIPADEKTCALFQNRFVEGKIGITVVPRGRGADGKVRFDCSPRHYQAPVRK